MTWSSSQPGRVRGLPSIWAGHYAINFRINGIAADHIDLEDWGRQHGCLGPWERLRDDGQGGR